MKIFVKVKVGAKKETIKKIGERCFLIAVKARPEKGKANLAVERVIAEYFGVSISRVKIISGATSKEKILEV